MSATLINGVGISFRKLRPVQVLIQTAEPLAAGDLRVRTSFAPASGELRQLAQAFDQMAAALEEQTEQQRQAHHDLRTLTARLAEAQESERKNLTRELQD